MGRRPRGEEQRARVGSGAGKRRGGRRWWRWRSGRAAAARGVEAGAEPREAGTPLRFRLGPLGDGGSERHAFSRSRPPRRPAPGAPPRGARRAPGRRGSARAGPRGSGRGGAEGGGGRGGRWGAGGAGARGVRWGSPGDRGLAPGARAGARERRWRLAGRLASRRTPARRRATNGSVVSGLGARSERSLLAVRRPRRAEAGPGRSARPAGAPRLAVRRGRGALEARPSRSVDGRRASRSTCSSSGRRAPLIARGWRTATLPARRRLLPARTRGRRGGLPTLSSTRCVSPPGRAWSVFDGVACSPRGDGVAPGRASRRD